MKVKRQKNTVVYFMIAFVLNSCSAGIQLTNAIRNGNNDRAKSIVKTKQVDLNRSYNGLTPLTRVIKFGKLDMVKYLVENGANVNAKNDYGWAPLVVAAELGKLDMVKYLVENSANVNTKSKIGSIGGITALILAAQANDKNNIEIAKYLIENGADVNAQHDLGGTALFGAAELGKLDMVKYLVENGANVNYKYKGSGLVAGSTVLIQAAQANDKNNIEIVKYLIENGADVNAQTKNGATALIAAAEDGKLDIVKYLVKHGANVDLALNDGKNAISQAKGFNHHQVVSFLEKVQLYKEQSYFNEISNKEIKKEKPEYIDKIEIANKTIESQTLKSDEDIDIPISNEKDRNLFALIIGNEDYRSYQTSLSSEQNVDFAINDAEVFKKYCIQTLGVLENNIVFEKNAGVVKMKQALNKINTVIKYSNGKAKVIVYYAGHGLPDDNSKIPYLIPVDVSGNNLDLAISLQEMYNKLTEYPSQKIVVFLDACFTGGGRNAGLVSSRSVKIKPRENVLKGNIVVFSASSAEQSSLPYKEKNHGMFTYYLLKVLKETSGAATLGKIDKYLKQNVPIRSSLENGVEQFPVTNVSIKAQNEWENWVLK